MNSSRKSSLPPHFIGAMRTLFDIMDTERSGFIRLEDLLSRWERHPPAPSTGIPPAFIPCLRKVTPANGLLTFERFCAGLRLALAENRLDQQARNYPHKLHQLPLNPPLSYKVKSDGDVNASSNRGDEEFRMSTRRKIAAERAKSAASQPSLPIQEPIYGNFTRGDPRPPPVYSAQRPRVKARAPAPPPYGQQLPPKPMRTAVPPPPGPRASLPGLAEGVRPKRLDAPYQTSSSSASSSDSSDPHSPYVTVHSSPNSMPEEGVRWRDKNGLTVITDGRRHTVSEASAFVDSRHVGYLAEEEELLEKGLAAAARLANFLHTRLATVRTRAKLLGKGMVPMDSAVQEEKLNYLRAHVTELSRRINGVVESSERGFPAQLNLESSQAPPDQAQITWLRKQNQQLTQEVSRASSQLRALESEKAELAHRLRFSTKSPSPLSSSTPSPPSRPPVSHYASAPAHYSQAQYGSRPTPLIYAPPPARAQRPPLHPANNVPQDPISSLYKDYHATLI